MNWAYPIRTAGQTDPFPTEWSLSSSQPSDDRDRFPQPDSRSSPAEDTEPAA